MAAAAFIALIVESFTPFHTRYAIATYIAPSAVVSLFTLASTAR